MTGKRLTDRERDRILKLRGDGLSIDRIATKIKRNPRTVMDAIRKAEVEEMDRRDDRSTSRAHVGTAAATSDAAARQESVSPDSLGVVWNPPDGIAGAALHPPVARAGPYAGSSRQSGPTYAMRSWPQSARADRADASRPRVSGRSRLSSGRLDACQDPRRRT